MNAAEQPRASTRTRRWALAALGAVTSAGAVATFLALRAPGPAVETAVVERASLVRTAVASGRVVPVTRVSLGSLAVGRVTEVAVDEGDAVQAGQVLVRLDDAEAAADVQRAEARVEQVRARLAEVRGAGAAARRASLESREAALRRAEDDLGRVERLAASGAVSAQDLARARTEVDVQRAARDAARSDLAGIGAGGRQAAADLAGAEAEAEGARVRLERLRIAAPAAGTILARAVEPGDVVAAGQVLLELAVDGPVEIRIDPDESLLAELEVGQQAVVSAESFPDRLLAARVREIAPAVDAQRGTIEVRLALDEPPAWLRADMTVSVEVETARRADALVLPADAVRDVGSASPWVLVIEDGVARRRDVRLGAIGEDRIEILAGVREGERAVPTTAAAIAPGRRVRGG